jgi:hypothetical protein
MNETSPEPGCAKYITLIIWLGVFIALLLIPLRIVGYGFLPSDDALRHAAKVISGKTWSEITVMRPGITIDHNAGWHGVLGAVRRLTAWDADGLVTFSVACLAGLFLLAPLAFSRRPEAWVAAMLAVTVAYPHFPYRIMLGRPYIFVMTAMIVILALWQRSRFQPRGPLLAFTTILIAIAAWIHGGWYLYWLPAAGLILAQQWRAGLLMGLCWALGSFLGGLFTGHPVYFLSQQFQVLVSCLGTHTAQRLLVTEFQPSDGQLGLATMAALAVLARGLRGESPRSLLRDPVFMMAALCWTLGLYVRRFSLDWGAPALLVWMAAEFALLFERLTERASLSRLIVAGLLSAGLLFAATNDLEDRWTRNLTKEYLRPETPGIEGWLPDAGGIVYSDNMRFFYDMFFMNPNAPWRYMLGFESTFMPDEDLETLRKIQWNYGTPEAYKPWVGKMTPSDRLILKRSFGAQPDIPELEWRYAATDTWIGRLPRPAATPAP